MHEASVVAPDGLTTRTSRKAQVSLWLGSLGLLFVLAALTMGLYYLGLLFIPALGSASMSVSEFNQVLESVDVLVGDAAVLGLAGVVAGIVALVLGVLGLRDIRAGQGRLAGRAAGRWGMVLGALSVLVALTLCALVYVLFGVAHM